MPRRAPGAQIERKVTSCFDARRYVLTLTVSHMHAANALLGHTHAVSQAAAHLADVDLWFQTWRVRRECACAQGEPPVLRPMWPLPLAVVGVQSLPISGPTMFAAEQVSSSAAKAWNQHRDYRRFTRG